MKLKVVLEPSDEGGFTVHVPSLALDRPVDIVIKNNGEMYISDDKAEVVYRVAYENLFKSK